jgi:hypothetical protein
LRSELVLTVLEPWQLVFVTRGESDDNLLILSAACSGSCLSLRQFSSQNKQLCKESIYLLITD